MEAMIVDRHLEYELLSVLSPHFDPTPALHSHLLQMVSCATSHTVPPPLPHAPCSNPSLVHQVNFKTCR